LQNRNRSPERMSSCVTCPCRSLQSDLKSSVPSSYLPTRSIGSLILNLDLWAPQGRFPSRLIGLYRSSGFPILNWDLRENSDLGAPSGFLPGRPIRLYQSSRCLILNSDLLANSDLWERHLLRRWPDWLQLGLLTHPPQRRSRELLRRARLTHPTHPRPRPMRHPLRLRLGRSRVRGRRQENMRRQWQAFFS